MSPVLVDDVDDLFRFIVELLEQPTADGDIEAVKKAKILYRSCMNESEFQTNREPNIDIKNVCTLVYENDLVI